jgi:5-methylthioribose kinase
MGIDHLVPELTRFLESEGLIERGSSFDSKMLPGGVSSDIHLVSGSGEPVVVKRALAELKVEGTWRAPVERSAHEAAYLRVAGQLVPGFCPRLLAHDETSGYLAMEYFDPQAYPLWKTQLLAGTVEVETAASVGHHLGKIHSAASKMPGLAEEFDTTDAFRSLRLHPYLETLPAKHPQIAAEVDRLILMLLSNRMTLVHGDVSPKNILVGSEGPVLLDAECAWWGDPAFDLGFCTNHLFLKSFLLPRHGRSLMQSVSAFIDAYRPHVSWEDSDAVLQRTAALLPALMLARVDGLSPVEYLDNDQRETVRDFAFDIWGREGISLDAIVEARLLGRRT